MIRPIHHIAFYIRGVSFFGGRDAHQSIQGDGFGAKDKSKRRSSFENRNDKTGVQESMVETPTAERRMRRVMFYPSEKVDSSHR